MTSLPDFDTLRQLAQTDPEALARLRQTLVEETIQSAHPARQAQLHALQSHVDRTLQRASNPYHGLIQVMALMQDKLYCLAQVMNDPDAYLNQRANILPFRSESNPKADPAQDEA